MGEISLDASTVSRFIVSLSKSIQALCHGCMEFDTSIEMIGYININIDSGKTVDCVLNEKVQRSTANSMTCISNSFQAKKEKPKQTKDGSCSPIPTSEYSFHQSAHKRPYRNDYNALRGHPRKKHRFHAKPVMPYPQHYSSSADTAFHEQSSTTSSEYTDTQQHVKTEAHENVTPDYDNNAASTSSENFLVKQEQMDAAPAPEISDETQQKVEPSQFSESDKIHSHFEGEQSNTGQFENDGVETESSYHSAAATDGNQDTHGADNQQPHGSHEDAGDDDNFEVIEIGDDDEDVQGLFDPAGARMVQHLQDQHQHQHQQMLASNALYQWTTNHSGSSILSSPEYHGYVERERRKHLAKAYRLNRTNEQRERDRRLARMRQRKRRARLREHPEQEETSQLIDNQSWSDHR